MIGMDEKTAGDGNKNMQNMVVNTKVYSRVKRNYTREQIESYVETGDYEGAIRECYSSLRKNGEYYLKAKQNVAEVDGNKQLSRDYYASTDIKPIIGSNFVAALCSDATKLIPVINNFDYKASRNLITAQSMVISNLHNEFSMAPTSLAIDHLHNLSFWYDSSYCNEIFTKVFLEPNNTEYIEFGDITSKMIYADKGTNKDVAKGLLCSYSKIDDYLDDEGINRIITKLRTTANGMSRYTRLVIACMYYYSLLLIDGDVTTVATRRPQDEILLCNIVNYSALAARDDMAYVYCNQAEDKAYLYFLYVISREFPFCRDLLVNNYKGEGCSVKYSSMSIAEEASYVGIICTTQPADFVDKNISYNAMSWYSYIIQYSRSIAQESRLDEAFATAALLMNHDLIYNVTLPVRKSVGELFQHVSTTKIVERTVPLHAPLRLALFGGYVACCGLVTMYKEIISHDKILNKYDGNGASVYNTMLIGTHLRQRWCSALLDGGVGDIVKVFYNLDVFKMSGEGDKHFVLSEVNIMPYYIISNYDSKYDLGAGFLRLVKKSEHENRLKLAAISRENRSDIMAHKLMLGHITGLSHSCAKVLVTNPVYDAVKCDIAEGSLKDGIVSIVKGKVLHISVVKYSLKDKIYKKSGLVREGPPQVLEDSVVGRVSGLRSKMLSFVTNIGTEQDNVSIKSDSDKHDVGYFAPVSCGVAVGKTDVVSRVVTCNRTNNKPMNATAVELVKREEENVNIPIVNGRLQSSVPLGRSSAVDVIIEKVIQPIFSDETVVGEKDDERSLSFDEDNIPVTELTFDSPDGPIHADPVNPNQHIIDKQDLCEGIEIPSIDDKSVAADWETKEHTTIVNVQDWYDAAVVLTGEPGPLMVTSTTVKRGAFGEPTAITERHDASELSKIEIDNKFEIIENKLVRSMYDDNNMLLPHTGALINKMVDAFNRAMKDTPVTCPHRDKVQDSCALSWINNRTGLYMRHMHIFNNLTRDISFDDSCIVALVSKNTGFPSSVISIWFRCAKLRQLSFGVRGNIGVGDIKTLLSIITPKFDKWLVLFDSLLPGGCSMLNRSDLGLTPDILARWLVGDCTSMDKRATVFRSMREIDALMTKNKHAVRLGDHRSFRNEAI